MIDIELVDYELPLVVVENVQNPLCSSSWAKGVLFSRWKTLRTIF